MKLTEPLTAIWQYIFNRKKCLSIIVMSHRIIESLQHRCAIVETPVRKALKLFWQILLEGLEIKGGVPGGCVSFLINSFLNYPNMRFPHIPPTLGVHLCTAVILALPLSEVTIIKTLKSRQYLAAVFSLNSVNCQF